MRWKTDGDTTVDMDTPQVVADDEALGVVVRVAVRTELQAFSDVLVERLRSEVHGPDALAAAFFPAEVGRHCKREGLGRGFDTEEPEAPAPKRRSAPLPTNGAPPFFLPGTACSEVVPGMYCSEVTDDRTEATGRKSGFACPTLDIPGGDMGSAGSATPTSRPSRPSVRFAPQMRHMSSHCSSVQAPDFFPTCERAQRRIDEMKQRRLKSRRLNTNNLMALVAQPQRRKTIRQLLPNQPTINLRSLTFRQMAQSCNNALRRVVASAYFDYVVCLALVLNSVLIGVEANFNALGESVPATYRAMEVFFCIFFTVELLVRIVAYRSALYTGGDLWGYFDTFLVALQIADELMLLAPGEEGEVGFGDASLLRLARILKLLRILRLLRVIRFVSELRKVMYLIVGSIGSFVWTAVLLVMMLYVLAVFFTQIVADYAVDGDLNNLQAANHVALQRYFGSTLTSLDTLYKAITGGFNWDLAGRPLNENVSPLAGVGFALFIAFAVLVLLNLVTGVFVEGALRVSRADMQNDLLERAYSLFCRSDEDHSGDVTFEEFCDCLDSQESARFFEMLEISQDRAEDLFRLIDRSHDGKLSLEELVAGGVLLQGPAKAIDVALVTTNLQNSLNMIMERLGISTE